uniref:Uncharacterized protein n=1 Tax=Alexandrium monilatum TaxID=311494 RepID=A0A7S4UED8_9DINO
MAQATEEARWGGRGQTPASRRGPGFGTMGEADDLVSVPRQLLAEILEDGTCPLHLRLQLRKVMGKQRVDEADLCSSITLWIKPCLPLIAAKLPLAEVLSVRACSSAGLEWVMQRGVAQLGGTSEAHDRIRTRLWIHRVAELNRESADETVYETPVRRLADDALRRRMEAEMADARHDMEQQIRAFQVEVDRRMEQQAVRVHAIVEERVQQQLDTILVAEMEKVRTMVEERVQGRVRAVVQREVHATVCEMQVRQAMLAHENERLRAALLEQLDHSDLCFRSLMWALSPNATGFFARTLRLMWSCRRRFTRFSAWLLGVPPDRRREGLRTRLEALQRAASDFEAEEPAQGAELRSLLAPAAERELPELPQTMRRQLLMAIMAAAAALPAEVPGQAREPRALVQGEADRARAVAAEVRRAEAGAAIAVAEPAPEEAQEVEQELSHRGELVQVSEEEEEEAEVALGSLLRVGLLRVDPAVGAGLEVNWVKLG